MRQKSEIVQVLELRIQDIDELIDYVTLDDIKMVEVGCFVGGSTSAFCASEKIDFLYAVDPWEGKYRGRDMSSIESQFDKRMSRFNNFKKLKMPSLEAVKLFDDRSLDLIYLDGLHTFRGVKYDIQAWKCKIKIGGYISGHDYRMNANIGVKNAVKQFLGEPEAVFCDSSWIFKVND